MDDEIDKEFQSKPDLSHFLSACFCPCFILGSIRSAVNREVHLAGNSCAIECFKTSLFAVAGWPFSPLLGWYLLEQRKLWTIIYFGKLWRPNMLSILKLALNWPTTLLAHKEFIERRKTEGILRFEWEEQRDMLSDILTPVPPLQEVNVVLMGPRDAAVAQFMHRLLQVNNIADDRTGDEEQQHGTEQEGIQFGMKCVSVSRSVITLLQVWAIPETAVAVTMDRELKTIFARVHTVAFMFNACSSESFSSAKDLFETLTNQGAFEGGAVKTYFIANQVREKDPRSVSFLLEVARELASVNGAVLLEISSQYTNSSIVKARHVFTGVKTAEPINI